MFIKLFVLFAFSFMITACITKNSKSKMQKKRVVKTERAIRNYIENNFDSYKKEYRILEDTVTQWSEIYNKITASIYLHEWELDEFIIFNEQRDKLIGFLTVIDTVLKGRHFDKFYRLRGIKDDQRWLFHLGPIILLSRSDHTDKAFSPLSFEKARILAHHYSSSFYKESKNNLVVDQDRFENYFSNRSLGALNGNSIVQTFEYYNQKRRNAKIAFSLEEVERERAEAITPEEPLMTEERKVSVDFWTEIFRELDALE